MLCGRYNQDQENSQLTAANRALLSSSAVQAPGISAPELEGEFCESRFVTPRRDHRRCPLKPKLDGKSGCYQRSL